MPFDNPATHLELTMVHEAMILENSGPNRGAPRVGERRQSLSSCHRFSDPVPASLPSLGKPLLAMLALAAISLAVGILVAVVEKHGCKDPPVQGD